MTSLSGQRVLVTGADGFIGSHLVQYLVESGASVRALVLYNSWNSTGWLADLDERVRNEVEIFVGDIRDTERVAEAIARQHYVAHLSSLIAIPYSYVAVRSYVETNVGGAVNVLEAARRSPTLERLIHTSTSEVYGTARQVPISEVHPLTAQSPYAASKIAADKMAESYQRSFGVPVTIARPFNTFGPRQTPRAVIPTIIEQLLARVPELKLGKISPTRDFNYVEDTARGIAALLSCEDAVGHVVNIGTGREWSIEETASLLMAITGHKVPIVTEETRIRPQESEVDRLLADASLMRTFTGWEPKVSFESGLRRTVEWVSEFRRPRTTFAI